MSFKCLQQCAGVNGTYLDEGRGINFELGKDASDGECEKEGDGKECGEHDRFADGGYR